jgi:hypothetical protein
VFTAHSSINGVVKIAFASYFFRHGYGESDRQEMAFYGIDGSE